MTDWNRRFEDRKPEELTPDQRFARELQSAPQLRPAVPLFNEIRRNLSSINALVESKIAFFNSIEYDKKSVTLYVCIFGQHYGSAAVKWHVDSGLSSQSADKKPERPNVNTTDAATEYIIDCLIPDIERRRKGIYRA